MTRLEQPIAQSVRAFLEQSAGELASLCTACGACFEACPMTRYVPALDGADARAVTQGLRALARGAAAPAETVAWVSACGKSGMCVSACPERDKGLDAMLLVRIARQQAINATGQAPAKHDGQAFPRVKTFARLQLSDEELDKWL